MGSTILTVGTTEMQVYPDANRTVLMFQNLDTVLTDYVYVSDEAGGAAARGIRLSGQGGSLTLRKSMGEEPEKGWRLVATNAATPVRMLELYGKVDETIPPEGGGNGVPPSPPPENGGQTSSCIMSAVIPFQPLLNIFRHIRSYCPGSLRHFYYRIPYPKREMWVIGS